MVRRHKAARWEAFLAPYREQADKDSEWFTPWMASQMISNRKLARIYRVIEIRGERRRRRMRNHRFYNGYYWETRQAYGRKQRRNR